MSGRLNVAMPADQLLVPQSDVAATAPCLYALPASTDLAAVADAVDLAAGMGFEGLLLLGADAGNPTLSAEASDAVAAVAAAVGRRGLGLWAAVCMREVVSDHPLATLVAPDAFGAPPFVEATPIDPRKPAARQRGVVPLQLPDDDGLRRWWREALSRLRRLGVEGFAQIAPTAPALRLAGAVNRGEEGIAAFYRPTDDGMAAGGNWLVDGWADVENGADIGMLLASIAASARGWALASAVAPTAKRGIADINMLLRRYRGLSARTRVWTAPRATMMIASRTDDEGASVIVHNRSHESAAWPAAAMPAMPWQIFEPLAGEGRKVTGLKPGELVIFRGVAPPPVAAESVASPLEAAQPARRVVISRLSPAVDAGAFAVKCVLGEWVPVEADIFADGHEMLAAAVLSRPSDDATWTVTRMSPQGNDVWAAPVRFARLGEHLICVEAWIDVWGGFRRDLAAKRAAEQDLALEAREGRAMVEAALRRADAPHAAALQATLAAGNDPFEQAEALLRPDVALAMEAVDDRRFRSRSFLQPVCVEREAARFSSWYEIFPRSQSGTTQRHGTFVDVIDRLPRIAGMGFDTLYFTPIHPIGRRNRKGRNNSLVAADGDLGSPYAIGAAEGGHAAIHPQLGTFDDFRRLLDEARRHGMEIALDFAIQCAPDHPWLTQHPGWFAWRPDGSVKYAENPPKKYQDIVNVDFYAPAAIPDLWLALCDVVAFWAGQGIRSFRVDNPHTKPLPFWHWLIASIKATYPDAIFLSEAFTRPKLMYHLAKVGFSQSYTYFTWRTEKRELTEYLLELTQGEARDFFRPHFFVNTPDINPLFLQTSGRAGFLIRAALAATLSGLWGVYAGFELCEFAALPGREEYLDSEKYELRARPDRAPGDIVDEITQLNRLRRQEPALQSHLGLEFHNATNESILYFSKTTPGQLDRLLIAICLDPHAAQEADIEVPLWRFDLADWEFLDVQDLLQGGQFRWVGKTQHIRLTPQLPYAIWRLTRPEGR
ncbi:MAG TPA: alpha-1,4-glucan--maltose-1-phosphate maltosyltransferase [Acetobacteraceae bacterium]|nr:alpha-1,4-glucan--maltose-1-phosphate maltosyltransferase [Acetobacteraceae bacterium]